MVDVDMHADFCFLLQVADAGMVGVGDAINEAQVALLHQQSAGVDIGMLGDAALETGLAVGVCHDLTDQVDAQLPAKSRRAADHDDTADVGGSSKCLQVRQTTGP